MEYKTKIIEPTDEGISLVANHLKSGYLAAIPTETVYGLATCLLNSSALEVFTVKERPSNNPLIVHVSSVEMARTLVKDFPPVYEQLAKRFWPGPLTLLCEHNGSIPPAITASLPTVGIRMPLHPVARALIEQTGPLAAPSANVSGRLSPTTAEHVLEELSGRIAYVLDGGQCTEGVESTIVDGLSGELRILRPGTIRIDQIQEIVPAVSFIENVDSAVSSSPVCPGMAYRHYSPDAELILVENEERIGELIGETSMRFGLLTCKEEHMKYGGECCVRYVAASEFPRALYSELRMLDCLCDVIAVYSPRHEAVLNRLKRAAKRTL